MVVVSKVNDDFVFEVKGLHKVWSLKSKIIVNKDNIINVKLEKIKWFSWIGWRLPGTALPFIIIAGTYFKNKERNFWDVSNKNKVILVELQNEKYNNLFIEVENVEETLNLLNSR